MERPIPKYGVFIIESIDLDNERRGNLDGLALKTILDLCDIPNDYYYIRTIIELENVIEKFEESNFGFLHIACHGSDRVLSLCFEDIKFEKLHLIIGNHLRYKRLFLSACKIARFELAKYFIPKYHVYSIIGTPENIDCDKAAIFWSAFYYLMYSMDKEQMFQVNLIPTLKTITNTFNLRLDYFSIINDRNSKSINHLREIHFKDGNIEFDEIRETEFLNQFR